MIDLPPFPHLCVPSFLLVFWPSNPFPVDGLRREWIFNVCKLPERPNCIALFLLGRCWYVTLRVIATFDFFLSPYKQASIYSNEYKPCILSLIVKLVSVLFSGHLIPLSADGSWAETWTFRVSITTLD